MAKFRHCKAVQGLARPCKSFQILANPCKSLNPRKDSHTLETHKAEKKSILADVDISAREKSIRSRGKSIRGREKGFFVLWETFLSIQKGQYPGIRQN